MSNELAINNPDPKRIDATIRAPISLPYGMLRDPLNGVKPLASGISPAGMLCDPPSTLMEGLENE